MEEVKVFERTKADYKDLESYLLKNELVDDRHIWFAGYDNYRKSTQNAVAGNLFYGYSRLIIVCIKDNDINYLKNSKDGFRLKVIGKVDEKNKASSSFHIMHPSVDITCNDGEFYSIKVIKNKGSIKEFKTTIK